MREMELAPFHQALRTDDADAAVREAAALLGVPAAKAAPKLGAVEAVDRFLAGVRPGWPAADGSMSGWLTAPCPMPI